MYTISQLAQLAGVSTRTLRYYDQLKLLEPEQVSAAGYRLYGSHSVDKLQQILFFRELAFSLGQITEILSQPDLDYVTLLTEHRQSLLKQQQRFTALIATLDQTVAAHKGAYTMSDHEKFEAFKTATVQANEEQYGAEIRKAYGDEWVDASQTAFLQRDADSYNHLEATEQTLFLKLQAHGTIAIPSPESEEIFQLHRTWLQAQWTPERYQVQAHRGLGELYLANPEFTAYYDNKCGHGATLKLKEIIDYYA